MATSTRTDGVGRGLLETWHTGVGIGIAGVIPMILFSTVVGGQDLFPLFGLIPYAVAWGLLYAGLASVDRIRRLAAAPRTAAPTPRRRESARTAGTGPARRPRY